MEMVFLVDLTKFYTIFDLPIILLYSHVVQEEKKVDNWFLDGHYDFKIQS